MAIKMNIICIVGATASGKTSLSIKLAKKIGSEIVSADSMQIYKHMDIGTAKPDIAEREGIPHFMIDICMPSQNYSVIDYFKNASVFIDNITVRDKTPIVVGGTGLYFDSLTKGLSFFGPEADDKLRTELNLLAEEQGVLKVHKRLAEIDKESAEKIHPNNLKRVIRAIEIYNSTGIKMSDHINADKEKKGKYTARFFALRVEQNELYARVDERVDVMIKQGLVNEVEKLIDMGIDEKYTAMQAIGYKELTGVIKRGESLEEAIELIKQRSRNYAKRQLTWFKRDDKIIWLDKPEQINEYF